MDKLCGFVKKDKILFIDILFVPKIPPGDPDTFKGHHCHSEALRLAEERRIPSHPETIVAHERPVARC